MNGQGRPKGPKGPKGGPRAHRHPYDHWGDGREPQGPGGPGEGFDPRCGDPRWHARRDAWWLRMHEARLKEHQRRLTKMRRWAEMEAGSLPFPRRRGWRWHLRVRNRWHQRWHRQHAMFRHSLGARLIAVFVVLACLGSAILWGAMTVEYGLLWAVPLLLLVTGIAYAGIRHMVDPLHQLALGAEAFGRGDLSHRILVRHDDEIGDLAMRFNQMAEDIQGMLDGKRALLLAISHELRSPLTRARLHAELVDDGPSKAALLEELAQMRELISALLESERLGSGHRALQVDDCDLGALAREQDQPGVALRVDRDLPLLKLDRMRVQLLLRNLVSNALRHNDPDAGPVMVSVERDGEGARLTVRDHGAGVPPEALAQLGQPFYRPDEARARSEGGVGLGLSLCRLVAEAHGSRLELRNAQPGFEAVVRFE
ncbi:HAMP domain-containing sensor histidine kinase [Roseateles sp.]|uniref:sensor histidine kinase n=1 Tax=Roseateles sp. TaxID=1971397 RepID=UPI0031E35F96